MLSKEELLRPRWKVIADFPSNPYDLGHILYDNKLFEYDITMSGSYNAATIYFAPDNYPAIFKKLEWWEDRSIEICLII